MLHPFSAIFRQFLDNPPLFKENLPKKGHLFGEFGAQKPTHMGGTYPYPQHVMYPPPPGETYPSNSYNPGQNKLGHWQIAVFSSCFVEYRGENISLEPSHPPSPLIQCWDGRMAFDSTNIETGGAGGTESKTEVVQFCDLSQEF